MYHNSPGARHNEISICYVYTLGINEHYLVQVHNEEGIEDGRKVNCCLFCLCLDLCFWYTCIFKYLNDSKLQ